MARIGCLKTDKRAGNRRKTGYRNRDGTEKSVLEQNPAEKNREIAELTENNSLEFPEFRL
jgi:hypothetical protein